jgi:hypothetical protein
MSLNLHTIAGCDNFEVREIVLSGRSTPSSSDYFVNK